MLSELELLRQHISELEAKNAKLEIEKAEIEARNAELLKWVMKKDAKRDAKNTELKSRVGVLEARLAILEQGVTEVTGQLQNNKEVIAEVLLSTDNPVSTVDVSDSIEDQQNSVNIKVIEDKEIDDSYPEEPANVPYFVMTQLKWCKPDHEVNDVVPEVP
ncbi:36532_t:CDS:1, partial [Gigaspora margarita]